MKHAGGPRHGHPSNEKWARIKELMMTQEPTWLWFTLPELGFPLLTDEYRRPIHPEIEEYMRKYVSNDQDWEKADDEDCWGINYTEPTAQIREKWKPSSTPGGGKQPEEEQDEITKLTPETERFSVPHASRDPRILKDRNLENEDIFEIIRNPPEKGAVRIFEKPEFWDSTIGLTHSYSDHTRHSHNSTTIRTSKHGRSTMAPIETHLNKR